MVVIVAEFGAYCELVVEVLVLPECELDGELGFGEALLDLLQF